MQRPRPSPKRPRRRAPAGRCRRSASGGGYSGPLVYRTGEGMRPDVAAAFDRMAAAASRRRPHPRRQLRLPLRRRTGGALRRPSRPDLGGAARATRCTAARPSSTSGPNPPTAGWPPTPAASASSSATRWEAWHYGFDAGPPPCSAAGDVGRRGGPGRTERRRRPGGAPALPSFVPARFRAPLLRAAARWNVSAALLAAQLMAESNFNPFAGSPGRRPGHRPVHALAPRPPTACATPSTRSKRSTPRPT